MSDEKNNLQVLTSEEAAELQGKLDGMYDLIQEQQAKIKSLEGKTSELETPEEEKDAEKKVTPEDTFKVKNKAYRFTVPKYIIPGKGVVYAADMLKNKAELERLVTIESGVVKRVEK